MAPKVFWKSLLVAPAVLGAALVASSAAFAADVQEVTESANVAPVEVEASDVEQVVDVAEIEQVIEAEASVEIADLPAETSVEVVDASSLDQVIQYSNENPTSASQLTSITQLSDVYPTDWAYQALQSLVERYSCIVGYPDGTYRGQQALTRYEFAAGLNACLDRINEIIATGLADVVTREDLAAIQRLQEEFAAELATLRGRVDALEARVEELEANQFSTTTKLNGYAIFSAAAEFGDVFDDQPVFGYRVEQNFDTSFTGEDRLRVRFRAQDTDTFAADPEGFSYSGDNGGDVVLNNLFYDFPLTNSIDVRIGANNLDPDELVASTISPLDSSSSGSLSNFGFPSQYDTIVAGDAGLGVIIQLSDAFSIDLGYTAGGGDSDVSDPDPGNGLFNGSYSAIGQLTYLGSSFQAALTYLHTYLVDEVAEDIFDTDNNIVGNTFGFQMNFNLGSIDLGGGIAYTEAIELETGDADIWSYQGTLVFNDFGAEGNKLMFLAGVLPYSLDGGVESNLISAGIDPGGDTSFLAELSYLFRVNDNISITPGIIYIEDAQDSEDDAFIGAIRTTFEF